MNTRVCAKIIIIMKPRNDINPRLVLFFYYLKKNNTKENLLKINMQQCVLTSKPNLKLGQMDVDNEKNKNKIST